MTKNSRPFPLYESVGVEEVNSIELRDRSGAVHRQMVTPEVYERYARGQYFNDQQSVAAVRPFQPEDPGVTARPIAPVAGAGRSVSEQGLVQSNQSKKKSVASITRRPSVASHSPASNRSTVKTVAVVRPRVSTPAVAPTNSVEPVSAPPAISTNANNEGAVASMATFSSEITTRGARSATLNAAPSTSAPAKKISAQILGSTEREAVTDAALPATSAFV